LEIGIGLLAACGSARLTLFATLTESLVEVTESRKSSGNIHCFLGETEDLRWKNGSDHIIDPTIAGLVIDVVQEKMNHSCQ
jgi:hypothetical protein